MDLEEAVDQEGAPQADLVQAEEVAALPDHDAQEDVAAGHHFLCLCHNIDEHAVNPGPLVLTRAPAISLGVPDDHAHWRQVRSDISHVNAMRIALRNGPAALNRALEQDYRDKTALQRNRYLLGPNFDRSDQLFHAACQRWRAQNSKVESLENELHMVKDRLDEKIEHMLNLADEERTVPFTNARRIDEQRFNIGCEVVDQRMRRLYDSAESFIYELLYRQVEIRHYQMRARHLELRLGNEQRELESLKAAMFCTGGNLRGPPAGVRDHRRGSAPY